MVMELTGPGGRNIKKKILEVNQKIGRMNFSQLGIALAWLSIPIRAKTGDNASIYIYIYDG